MFKLFNSYIYIRQNLPPASNYIARSTQQNSTQHYKQQAHATLLLQRGTAGVRLGLVLLVRDQARFKQKRLGTHH
jgi:hypothetical protein